jgi:uncharacterized membrane protein
MKKDLKIIGFWVSMICFHGTAMAAELDQEAPPRLIMFLGRFHPVLLHLPIGAFIITFFLDIMGRIRKDYPRSSIVYGLGFSAFFAILSCVLGYFLSLEEGYEGDVVTIHLWLGIATAILISSLFILLSLKKDRLNVFVLPLFIVSLIVMSFAGHFGSTLTHGDKFLTEYMGPEPKLRTIVEVDSLKIYDDVVARILDDKCVQCHNATKRKSGLSLVSPEMILKGGDNGEVVHKNNADESAIYSSSFLPLSDDNHMPPEGKKQLTKNEQWLIRYWIDHELDFYSTVSSLPRNDSLAILLKDYLVFEQIRIDFASEAALNKAVELGFRVRNLVQGKAGLSVKFLKPAFGRKELNALTDLKHQIVELDLSNCDLSDQFTSSFEKFDNLEKLRLDNTLISDESMDNLSGLKRLKTLNLYGTRVSMPGLENFLNLNVPEKIYIWNTQVTQDEARYLSDAYKTEVSAGVFDGFIEKAALKPPVMRTEKTLFTDTLNVNLGVEMKGAIIRYTLDGSEPDSTSNVYTGPIILDSDKVLKAKAYKKEWYPSESLERSFYKVRHEVSEYTIVDEPEIRYPGSFKLFDLKEGTLAFKDGRWTGFLGYDLNTTVDLESPKRIRRVSVNCLENIGNWIMLPEKLELYASLQKDTGFEKVGELKIKKSNSGKEPIVERYTLEVPETTGRYFKIIVRNPKVLPEWHDGAGQPSWIFIDEVILW